MHLEISYIILSLIDLRHINYTLMQPTLFFLLS